MIDVVEAIQESFLGKVLELKKTQSNTQELYESIKVIFPAYMRMMKR